MDLKVRKANTKDIRRIENLLSRADLPTRELDVKRHHFFVGELKGKIITAGGLEIYRKNGLLRSFVVEPKFQSKGLGAQLHQHMIEVARKFQLKEIWLLTAGAERFFTRLGYEKSSRAQAPSDMRKSWQFEHGACRSATVMRFDLSQRIYNLNGKKFILKKNLLPGIHLPVGSLFVFKQYGKLVKASYSGGKVQDGFLLGKMEGNRISHQWCHITEDNELNRGLAEMEISSRGSGKLVIRESWQGGGSTKMATALLEEITR